MMSKGSYWSRKEDMNEKDGLGGDRKCTLMNNRASFQTGHMTASC
jgi:hypothetical protein